MFSTGQLIFAVLFLIGFIIVLVYAYSKDKGLHSIFYKGNYKILLGFIVFVVFLFFIKKFLRH